MKIENTKNNNKAKDSPLKLIVLEKRKGSSLKGE